MKKRVFSILTALALCLTLLPGTARAAEGETGPVTITDNAGQSVALAAGKYYQINNTLGGASGGVTELADAPTGKAYLTYADGVLTVCGKEGNTSPIEIFGKMVLSADLEMAFDSNAQASGTLLLTGTGNSGPAFSLNGHTLTLGKGMNFKVQSGDQPAVDGGTIRFTESSNDNTINIRTVSSNAVSGDLAVEKAWMVIIGGKPPVFQSLDVKECDQVQINSYDDTELSSTINRITIDRPISLNVLGKYDYDTSTQITTEGLMMQDHTVWTNGGGFSYGTHFINTSVTTPTAYKAGDGWALYTPGDNGTGTPAKLTLDGASYNGTLNIQQANSVQLELKGENAVTKLTTDTLTLTGDGNFTGIFSGGTSFTNNSTGTLNAVVECPQATYTVYGNRSTSDFPGRGVMCSERTPLTITNGATLTVPEGGSVSIQDIAGLKNHGTIVNEGEITIVPTTEGTPNLGTIVNNGRVAIAVGEDSSDEEIPAFIKALHLTGTGSVETCYTVQEGSNWVDKTKATYTHSGLKLLEPPGTDGKLDLSSTEATDANWDTQGYKWENVEKDQTTGAITSATLTLAEGFNATSVTLPNAAVTIVTTGESRIGTLSAGSDPNNAKLTFSGPGKLTITEHVEISGGAGNIITVNEGAKVVANNGISIGASGGIDSTVTVNGTLTVAQGTGTSAIYGGKVSVGDTGVLEVSGKNGVQLNGMTDNFNNLFTVIGNGRFTADCSEYNIKVNVSDVNKLPKDESGNPDVKAVINLTDEYLPDDCEAKLDEVKKQIDLVRKSTGEVYKGPLTIHKNHVWSSAWTDGGGDTHHHACTYLGCTAKNDERPHYYAHGADACRDCGHARPAGAPDSDSGSSGDFIGSFGGFDGFSNRDSGYTVTVEESSHGKVSSDRVRAGSGSAVTLTASPDSGYILDVLTVTDSQGNDVGLTQEDGGKYTFIMPDRDVTVRASFVRAVCTGDADCPSRAFPDLDTGSWYHEAVDYVLRSGLMDGYTGGLFGPNDPLSRVQFAQILYNRAGRPAVTGSRVFTDTAPGAWYADAVAWAVGQDIAGGYGDGRFGPDDPITREQLAAILWRYAGRPEPPDLLLTFSDADQISPWAAAPLRWAVERGIVSGKGSGILDPQGTATRAEAAQMLKNFLEQQH